MTQNFKNILDGVLHGLSHFLHPCLRLSFSLSGSFKLDVMASMCSQEDDLVNLRAQLDRLGPNRDDPQMFATCNPVTRRKNKQRCVVVSLQDHDGH